MPYTIKKFKTGFKVCKRDKDKCFSKEPIPLTRAKKQLKAIGITSAKGGSINIKEHLQGFGEEVKEVEEEPMDDEDIRDNLGQNTKILKYSDLSKYKSLEDLLPRKRDYLILLYLDAPNQGHWTCLIRDDNNIYFFCSYGSKVDEPLSWVDCNTRNKLGVLVPYLTRLFNNSKGFNLYYNPVQYQNERNDVNTCGRYCTLLIEQFKKHLHYNLYDFYNYMNRMKSKYKLTYDEIASTLINE